MTLEEIGEILKGGKLLEKFKMIKDVLDLAISSKDWEEFLNNLCGAYDDIKLDRDRFRNAAETLGNEVENNINRIQHLEEKIGSQKRKIKQLEKANE